MTDVESQRGQGVEERRTDPTFPGARRMPTSIVEAADEALYMPRKRRRRGLGKVVGALVATLVVVALLLVHVWSRYRVLNLGYELSELSQEREGLLEENRRLRIELRILTRSDRLEPLAERQLGLIRPRHDQLFYVTSQQRPLPTFPTLTPDSQPPPPAEVGDDLALMSGETEGEVAGEVQ